MIQDAAQIPEQIRRSHLHQSFGMMRQRWLLVALLLLPAALLTACAAHYEKQPVSMRQEAGPQLPRQLDGKAVLLKDSDPDYARADLAGAVKPAGQGGIKEGLVVKLTSDVTVWRLWSGPAKKDARGNTSRLGQWWGYDPPRGSQEEYRRDYEICLAWNDLTWVARCTLKQGAVVAVGPGNSVTAETCGDATGKEAYPVNDRDWQIWISKVWTRSGADKELDCPPESEDYTADAADIAKVSAAAVPAK